MNIHEIATVPVSQKVATVATYGGASAAIIFGLNASELGVFIGLFVAFGAGVTNAYIGYHFKQKHFKLVEEYIKSGGDRQIKQDRRDDPALDVCNQCPMVKHRTDYDG